MNFKKLSRVVIAMFIALIIFYLGVYSGMSKNINKSNNSNNSNNSNISEDLLTSSINSEENKTYDYSKYSEYSQNIINSFSNSDIYLMPEKNDNDNVYFSLTPFESEYDTKGCTYISFFDESDRSDDSLISNKNSNGFHYNFFIHEAPSDNVINLLLQTFDSNLSIKELEDYKEKLFVTYDDENKISDVINIGAYDVFIMCKGIVTIDYDVLTLHETLYALVAFDRNSLLIKNNSVLKEYNEIDKSKYESPTFFGGEKCFVEGVVAKNELINGYGYGVKYTIKDTHGNTYEVINDFAYMPYNIDIGKEYIFYGRLSSNTSGIYLEYICGVE